MALIPKSFTLFGQPIKVKYDPALFFSNDVYGETRYRSKEIVLQPNTEETPVTQEGLEHTFFHELMHFLLYYGGDDAIVNPPLHRREYLVDRLGGLLHQAMATAEYGDEGP